jgi:hypothetical protein
VDLDKLPDDVKQTLLVRSDERAGIEDVRALSPAPGCTGPRRGSSNGA